MQMFMAGTRRTLFGRGLRLAAIAGSLAMVTAFAQPALAEDTCSVTGGETCTLDLDVGTQNLQEQINNKVNSADQTVRDTNQDTLIDSKVDATVQSTRDQGQDQALANEATIRREADKVLQDNIDAEAKTRADADDVLQDNIDAEADTREAADTALGGRITNEAAASRARDDALGKRIDKNSEAIEDAIALSAAIPDSWLSDSENFALALGGGFTDGSSAFGGIGMSDISAHGTN